MQEPSHCNCGERYSFNEARMLAAYTLHCHMMNSYYCSPRSTYALISAVLHRWHCSPARPSDVHRPSKSLPITQASGFHNASHPKKLTLHPLSRQCHSSYSETLFLSVRGIHFRIRVTFLTALRAHSGQTSALAIIIDYGQPRSLSNRHSH